MKKKQQRDGRNSSLRTVQASMAVVQYNWHQVVFANVLEQKL